LTTATYRTCSKHNGRRELTETFLPRIVRGDGGLPDVRFETGRYGEPRMKGHFRQQHELAPLRLHMRDQSFPVARESIGAVIQFTNGSFHTRPLSSSATLGCGRVGVEQAEHDVLQLVRGLLEGQRGRINHA
jgi:hypothetical protein